MTKAKLLLINGFNASGKTTIAQKYIADHSLAMAVEVDSLVDNIGDWTNHREEVRKLAFDLTKAILQAYLPSGHNVVLPYIVTDAAEAEQFESVAHGCGADFYEVVLYNDQSDAIARLLERGKWGGASSPAITNKDLPIIKKDFANMQAALAQRPGAIKIPLKGSSPDTTYQQLLKIVES